MLRVALTGGIGTGKSDVAERFRAAGVPVVDADHLARDVVAPGTAALAAIADRFGPDVIEEDGALRRTELAALVFADPSAVRRGIDAFFAALLPGTPFGVADIPLLFETGRAADFDVVVVAACPPEMQVARVMARDGTTEAAVRQRMAAQWPIEEKVLRATYVVDTSGSFLETDAAVACVVEALRGRAAES